MSCKTSRVTTITCATAAILSGCGTAQSTAFRQMTAVEHERAANTPETDPSKAGAHEAAAQRLREAERAACVDVAEVDRDEWPFARPDRIAGVDMLRGRIFPKHPEQSVGIALSFRAEPGMTQQWLARVIECHLAHHAVVGDAAERGSTCPLSLEGVTVAVGSTPTGFLVSITSRDLGAARSLVETGRKLVGDGLAKLSRD